MADEYLLEEVKNHCQSQLIALIDEHTFQVISEMGELYNAERIVEYCQWFQRRKMNEYGLDNVEHFNSGESSHAVSSSFSSTLP